MGAVDIGEVAADADGDGDSVFRIPEPFARPAEADKAAQSKVKELKRGEGAASVTVIGDTGVTAGSALLFQGIRPGLDGVPYIIDTATHIFSKSAGYQTAISAKLYDGKSGGAPADASSGAAATGTVANAPAGTPPTPPDWSVYRRNGHTNDN